MKNGCFKWLLSLLLCLSLACPAFAEETGAARTSVNASVVATDTQYVTAPFSGTLLPFSLSQGEQVKAGQTLFEMDTIKVYAGQSGTLAEVFAQPGDDASAVIERYGALAVIEPENPLYIAADTDNAYDRDSNKYLHVGETLYLKHSDDKGTGRVTSVDGENYTVEILTGEFQLGDTIKCYRDSEYSSKSVTGSGKAQRYADTAVTASGRVFKVHKSPGQEVKAGDLLFELIDASSAPDTSALTVTSPTDGAVTSVDTVPGAQVYQGQLLCQIADLSNLELSAEVDEIYLSQIQVGDTLNFVLDAYLDEQLTGTVTEIRPLGTVKQNATYYDVRLSIPEVEGIELLPSMSATVYLGE